MEPDEGSITLPDSAGSRGRVELLADLERPGGWLLLVDRIRQSYVDLEDPTYLDFEYQQAFADVLDALPDGPLAVTHVGGGALTLARFVSARRPGSPQIVLEPDGGLTDLVRARLPLPRGSRVRVRETDGRRGLGELRDGSADAVVVDAFLGGRVPAELTTLEFLQDVARVLRAGGVLLMNVADGPVPPAVLGPSGAPAPGEYVRRVVATVSAVFGSVLLIADPAVVKRRRFGNLVVAASTAALPVAEVSAAAARAMLPRTVVHGAELRTWTGATAPLTDADRLRSPVPPDESWRIGG